MLSIYIDKIMSTEKLIKDMQAEIEELKMKNKKLESLLSNVLNSNGYPAVNKEPETFDECVNNEQIINLFNKGRDINEYRTANPNEKNLKPIHKVKDDIVKLSLLISHGADINSRTYNEGETVLHLCARDNCVNSCHMLIAIGTDVNEKDYTGTTPIFNAIENPEIMRILIDAGADINVANYDGITPFMLAVTTNNIGACHYLINNGANINITYLGGITPLIYAVCKGYIEIVKLLIEHGADVNGVTENNMRPLNYAEDEAIKELLIKAGATTIL